MKRFNLFYVLLTLMFFYSSGSVNPTIKKITKVVIDAGHGGKDPGALGKKSKEKDIALSIALKLGNYIKTNFPDIEVVYTRKTDVFVELYERAQIANTGKADLFICIHCNSTKSTEVKGTETWVMGLNKSQANLEVAKKENASILFENDYTQKYDGFDPNSPEANIIFSLYQNAYLDQSLVLADQIQKQFTNKVGRVNRGVKQAGFLVLYKTTMPGVLIETGFISNAQEEDFLTTDNGQNLIASGIYRAFKLYKTNFEGNGQIATDDDTPDFVQEDQVVIKDTVKKKQASDSSTNKITNQKNEVFFRVQFTTLPNKKPLNSPDFKGLNDVRYYVQQNVYKYTAGNFKTLDEAVTYQHEVQTKGFKDAFVVAFLNEERVAPKEALKYVTN
ncbi:MAG: N-acetylmuramoyl-L-alanine amidase [Bacteroidota bacterium]